MRKLHMIFGAVLAVALAGQLRSQGTIPIVVSQSASCATSVDGTVVGLPNPLQVAQVATIGSGSLGAGTYYVEIAWYDAAGAITLVSPETQKQLLSTGTLQISPPANGLPQGAVGMKVYIGVSSGTETLQGTTVSSAPFLRSTPLVTGAAVPSSNTTQCKIVANDAGWPAGTGYRFSVNSASGVTLPGYPSQVQLLGPGQTYNVAQGLPQYNGTVTYPIPILARPYNHGGQSISGPLSMTGYKLTQVSYLGIGTSLPAWGVDAEVPQGGSPLEGAINAATGYLINGAGGTVNQAPCSDGTYINHFCTFVSSLPTLYYQTVDANTVAQNQRSALNFSSNFALTDSASPSRTSVDLITVGTPGVYTSPADFTTDAWGRVTHVTPSSAVNRVCNPNGCYRITSDGTVTMWGATAVAAPGAKWVQVAATFPYALLPATTDLQVTVSAVVPAPVGDGNPHTASCFVIGTPSTTAFNALVGITQDANSGGAGYTNLGTGAYCSYVATGHL